MSKEYESCGKTLDEALNVWLKKIFSEADSDYWINTNKYSNLSEEEVLEEHIKKIRNNRLKNEQRK